MIYRLDWVTERGKLMVQNGAFAGANSDMELICRNINAYALRAQFAGLDEFTHFHCYRHCTVTLLGDSHCAPLSLMVHRNTTRRTIEMRISFKPVVAALSLAAATLLALSLIHI